MTALSPDDPSESSLGSEAELPEREPLTPELVEDEALRGDFVIRWCVVLLALLVAMTEIAESRTLVHVKTGKYIASQGGLPPRNDVFSYTATDRPWTNLSWLFDLVASGVYEFGGWAGLSILKSLLAAGAIVFVIQTRRTGVSTWWSSICAAAAVVACQPRMTATPDVVTLLGLATVLWCWYRREESGQVRPLPWLVPVFALWSNLDPRMFLGLALLLLLATGESLRVLIVSPQEVRSSLKSLWLWAGACVAAAIVNPFGWRSILSPVSLYPIEYPAFRHTYSGGAGERDYSSIATTAYWHPLLPETAAALFLVVAAVVLVVLNRSRKPLAELFAVAGFAVFAASAAHELAAAALVSAVVAGILAQDWYRQRFRQTYSIATSELVFSRGGRALTVAAFLAIAMAHVGGRLSPAHRGKLGVGLTNALLSQADDLSQHLADALDDRPFNFYLEQGDLLIWVDQKVFIDSRLDIYARERGEDLISQHRVVRDNLRSRPEAVSPEIWKATFDKYRVTHVLPKLSGGNADYLAFLNLRRSRDWRLTKLTASTASFYRAELAKDQSDVRDYFATHSLNYVRDAFRTEQAPPEGRLEWAQGPSFGFGSQLLPQVSTRPNSIQLALHYQRQIDDAVSTPNMQLPAQVGAALAHLAVRHANAGLAELPRSADGFRVLGMMYEFLGRLESRLSGRSGVQLLPPRRYFQAVAAYRQALILDPAHRFTLRALAGLYSTQRRYDLSLRALEDYQNLTALQSNDTNDPADRLNETLEQLQAQLSKQVQAAEDRVSQQLQNMQADYPGIATFAYQQGCVFRAAQILDANPEVVAQQPAAQLLLSLSQFESGRFAEAEAGLARLELAPGISDVVRWESTAGMFALGRAQFDRSIECFARDIKSQQAAAINAVLQSLPLSGRPALERWPILHANVVANGLGNSRNEIAGAHFETGLTHLEAGRNQEAAAALKTMLEVGPNSPLRPVAVFYLGLITGEDIDPRPLSEQIPIAPDLFAPEPVGPAATGRKSP